jgi:hypothetical protein
MNLCSHIHPRTPEGIGFPNSGQDSSVLHDRSLIHALAAIEDLVRQASKDIGKWHTIMVASDEEEEWKTAALKASPKWTEGDNLMVIRLVGPDPDEVAQ